MFSMMNKERIIEKSLEDVKDVPTTKQAYGEHLYAQIKELYPAYALQLTGILMESDIATLILLLRDEELLMKRIDSALDILFGKTEAIQKQMNSKNKEHLGETLFQKVAEIETELCAQITGMLLDLDEESLQNLLDDPDELEVAVCQAKSAFLQHLPENLDTGPDSRFSTEYEQSVADRVYESVYAVYPNDAAKITGMLVELGVSSLEEMLQNPHSLQESVHKAKQALLQEKQQTPESLHYTVHSTKQTQNSDKKF